MTRILAVGLLLAGAAGPALACDWNKSASTSAPQPSTVAAQPATGTDSAPTTAIRPPVQAPS